MNKCHESKLKKKEEKLQLWISLWLVVKKNAILCLSTCSTSVTPLYIPNMRNSRARATTIYWFYRNGILWNVECWCKQSTWIYASSRYGVVICTSFNDLWIVQINMERKEEENSIKHYHLAIIFFLILICIFQECRCTCAIFYSSPSFCFALVPSMLHSLISVLNDDDKTHTHTHGQTNNQPTKNPSKWK